MKTVMVQYKTKKTEAETNATLIRAVFSALKAEAPKGFRYTSYRLDDGVTFVHIATMSKDNPLVSLPAFKAFQKGIEKRCVKQPVVTELAILESFGEAT